jgi:hypothetical protein
MAKKGGEKGGEKRSGSDKHTCPDDSTFKTIG